MKIERTRKNSKEGSMRQLEKTYSREHSLIYCYIWMLSDYGAYGLKDVLFIREPNSNKISVWYDTNKLDLVLKKIVKNINTKEGYIEEIKETFNQYWKEISPYLMRKKETKSLKELESYYKNLCRWWRAMAVIVAAPDVEGLLPKHKKALLALRNKTQHYADDQDGLFTEFIEKNLPILRDATYLISPEELFSTINKPLTKAVLAKIEKRRAGFFLFKKEVQPLSKLKATLGASGLELRKDAVENISEIKGAVGSRGKVKGSVCKVLYKEDISKVKEGDIIVTEMTSPEYLPAMQKAAAIITDEGGITCHAAIVARELKKPCIIGTKIATKVLKDGMMVEVDAEKGIVKIIK
jgi:phosphoenolpyruvate synthase/pyruvate phosphate dikinase